MLLEDLPPIIMILRTIAVNASLEAFFFDCLLIEDSLR